MIPTGLWKLLHLFFAFSYVGSLVVGEWNGRAARVAKDWGQRALLLKIVQLSSRVAGLGSLLLLGVFGNLTSVSLGYSMARDRWLMWVNGLWLLTVLDMAVLSLPNAGRLARISAAAAGGAPAEGFDLALSRWRLGNVVQSVLYLASLALMVFHWRS